MFYTDSMNRWFLSLAFLLFSLPAAAQESILVNDPSSHLQARDLMNMCKGQYDIDYGFCAGYITAISELMLDQAVYGQSACNHGPVASTQLMELTADYLKGDPSAQLQPASVATSKAIARSFACR